MTKITYKRIQALNALEVYAKGHMTRKELNELSNDALYDMLDTYNDRWDEKRQMWVARQQGTHGKLSKRSTVRKVLLVRVMGPREIIAEQMENFTIAMEACGYEILDISGPMANQGEGFHRVYLKVKVG